MQLVGDVERIPSPVRRALLLCVLLAAAVAAAPGRAVDPVRPVKSVGYWIWGSWPESTLVPSARITDRLYVHVGELSRRGGGWHVPASWPRQLPEARELVVVWRVDDRGEYGEPGMVPDATVPGLLASGLGKLTCERPGIDVVGVQIDFDCPTSKLSRYAELLQRIREVLPRRTVLSITTLLTWYEDEPRMRELLAPVDEHVPLFYDTWRSRGLFGVAEPVDAARYRPIFERLGVPYRLGISAFGRVQVFGTGDPEEARAVDIRPVELAASRAVERIGTRVTQAGETVVSYRVRRKPSEEEWRHDVDAGDRVDVILPGAASVRAAWKAASRFGRGCEGVVFFRWPEEDDPLAMSPDQIRSAVVGGRPEAASVESHDGGCVTVACQDVYVRVPEASPGGRTRFSLVFDQDVDGMVPGEPLGARHCGPREVLLEVPPDAGFRRVFVGRFFFAEEAAAVEVSAPGECADAGTAPRAGFSPEDDDRLWWRRSTVRPHLEARFWMPPERFAEDLFRRGPAAIDVAYAGCGPPTGNTAMDLVRFAYRDLTWPQDASCAPEERARALQKSCAEVHRAVATALAGSLTPEERGEAELVAAKIDMRAGEADDMAALARAKGELSRLARTAPSEALRSEARGWLGRVQYLRGDHTAAAKVYLDELARPRSTISRMRLIQSLHILYPYNGTARRLDGHLEEMLDTPAHALFALRLVTNPVYYDLEERRRLASLGRRALDAIHARPELFSSERLVLAAMRAAVVAGDLDAARCYASVLDGPTRGSVEYLWMAAATAFLSRRYADAEEPLCRIAASETASARERCSASRALVGVYARTGLSVEQLRAAFQANRLAEKARAVPYDEPRDSYAALALDYNLSGTWIDLAHLLEIGVSEHDLRSYLDRFPEARRRVAASPYSWGTPFREARSERDLVLYALAVRRARAGDHREASGLYELAGAPRRAASARRLAALASRAVDGSLAPAVRRRAAYDFACYMSDHSVGVLFNGALWRGDQTETLVEQYDPYRESLAPAQGLPRAERERLLASERELRDLQEERWQAVALLERVAEEEGRTPLGQAARLRALGELARIRTDRFGRQGDIEALRRRLNGPRP